jgi:hypothetical protein
MRTSLGKHDGAMRTALGRRALAEMVADISAGRMFAAVGVVERMGDSARLLDRVVIIIIIIIII